MKRNLIELTQKVYDLLVIGGGIYGATAAWEAASRGLSVALVDKGDFAAATSANSLKIIHGGLRYLQHADFGRMRQSIRERSTLLRIAPHLVHPLPFLIPTYGHGMQGKEVLALALVANDLISFDRNRQLDPEKLIPSGRLLSKGECLEHLPGIRREGLTGAALFYDAQAYNSERLILAFLHSAAKAGACLANYVEAASFLLEGGRVIGVTAEDRLTGDRFTIRARMVLNARGPWTNHVLSQLNGRQPAITYTKAMNLVTRPVLQKYAIGVSGATGYRDALLNRGNRLLFITPWRDHSLIGTTYVAYDGDPEDFQVTEQDVQQALEEINRAYPPADLKREDISFAHGGLLPVSRVDRSTGEVKLAKHYRIHDHRVDGVEGLLTVVGVKYTTARDVAEKAIDRVFQMWGKRPPRSVSAYTPLYGGQMERFGAFLSAEGRKRPYGLPEEIVRRLIYNYGSAYGQVLRYLDLDAGGSRALSEAVRRAEVIHGIREEMAQKLADVVLRRTELGTAGHPGDEALRLCAEVMGAELGWSRARMEQELQEVRKAFTWVSSNEGRDGVRLAGSAV